MAGGLAAALLCAGIGFILGHIDRSAADVTPIRPPAIVANPATPTATMIRPPSILNRADLIAAAGVATDGLSGGARPGADTLALEGRRFEVRLPLGCAGPSTDEAPLRWRYDKLGGTLRIDVTPVQWSPSDWFDDRTRSTIEKMQGFWIQRPWTSSEACPEPIKLADRCHPSPASETLGLVMLATATGSRAGRRPGEAYSVVNKVSTAEVDVSRGFRLRLTGRITNAPGAGPVICRALDGYDQRPTCLIAVILDEMALENGATGVTLATWTMSRQTDEERSSDAQPNTLQ